MATTATASIAPSSSEPSSSEPSSPKSSSGAATTSAPASGSADAPGPSASLPAAEAASVVFPAPGRSDFAAPEAAAQAFATDYAGFSAPRISDFRQGDTRSGEFEVTAAGGRLSTTVLVRQLSDGAWYVLGSVTADIQVTAPEAGSNVSSPVAVSGQARAFEGNVVVQVRDAAGEVLGQQPVTGSGGPDLGPFAGDIDFTEPGSGQGAVLFLTYSARDGSLEQVAAVPVLFGG